MEFRSEIKIKNNKSINVNCQTSLKIKRLIFLVISAFPNDYTPTQASLIGDLFKKG